jgi:hypothetical protein
VVLLNQLFKQLPLQNDIGLLRERWQQEGSTQVDANGGGQTTSPQTICTVTAGKVLYVKNILITHNYNGQTSSIAVRDNATDRMAPAFTNTNNLSIVFDVPLKFFTSVVSASDNGSALYNITISGWEEDL